MPRRRVPPTDEGWYILHDMRRVDWDAWRETPADERERIVETGQELLATLEEEGSEGVGDSGFYVGLGHEVDLFGIHLRPTLAELDTIERRVDASPLGAITDRVDSYVSVTEVSGYLITDYFDDDAEVDPGIERYINHRLHPELPDAEFVSFYPMSKRRSGGDNWYDLPFDERAEHMASHGQIGKGYAGKVTQIISGSIGFEDWEWGVTLFAKDPTVVKDLLYEMRFDPSTSRYAEFGAFTIGRPMTPEELPALLAGEPIGIDPAVMDPTSTPDEEAVFEWHGEADAPTEREREAAEPEPTPEVETDGSAEASAPADGGTTAPRPTGTAAEEAEAVRDGLEAAGVYTGQPHGEDIHALVLYSGADTDELTGQVDQLVENFDHYDTHVGTSVFATDGRHAIVSLWSTESAADTASGFLADLPGVEPRDGDGGWETMGLFYSVKPEHRDEFVETFEAVGDKLEGMDGHRETTLFVRLDDDCDMFISSRWDAREDAMAFFGGDAFRETVQWGRDVLQSRPRHVFLA